MKKKVILLIVIALLLVVSLFTFAYFTIWNDVDVSIEECYMKSFPSIRLDEKKYKELKTGNLEEYGYQIYQLKSGYEKKNSSIFLLDIGMKVKRNTKLSDYKIAIGIDATKLNDSEKIFFSSYNIDSPKDWFFGTFFEEGQEGRMGCDLFGITNGKSQKEIENIIKKLSFTLIFENERGSIIEKNISLNDVNIIEKKLEEDDIQSIKSRFEW